MLVYKITSRDAAKKFPSNESRTGQLLTPFARLSVPRVKGWEATIRKCQTTAFCPETFYSVLQIFRINFLLLKGSVYWQTVTVCQLEIIGRPCKKYLWALAHCRNLLNSAVIVALLYRASGVCQQEEIVKTITYFANGLPITSNWQTVTVCQ